MYELSVGRDGVSGTIRYFVIIDITQHRIPAHLWTEQSILTHTRKGDEAYPSMHTFVQIMYNLTYRNVIYMAVQYSAVIGMDTRKIPFLFVDILLLLHHYYFGLLMMEVCASNYGLTDAEVD